MGVLQGITEFFPISSTAHLVLVPRIFNFSGTANTLAFDVALHIGTLLALIAVFWRDWLRIFAEDRRLLLLLAAGSVPAAFFGLLFEQEFAERFRSPAVIAGMLALFGAVMLVSERFRGERLIPGLKLPDAMAVGFAQALALIPGVSRSGVTISVGLLIGMKREEAARFSFLLSMPVVAGAALYEGGQIGRGLLAEPGLFFTGIITSALVGLFAIRYLLKFLERHPVNAFAYYRFALALLIFWWAK